MKEMVFQSDHHVLIPGCDESVLKDSVSVAEDAERPYCGGDKDARAEVYEVVFERLDIVNTAICVLSCRSPAVGLQTSFCRQEDEPQYPERGIKENVRYVHWDVSSE